MTAPVVAVSALATRDGELLFVSRGRDPDAGRWAIPGGRVHPGETLHEAVVREVAEETGLDVVVDRFVGWSERIGATAHYVIMTFACTVTDPGRPVQPGDDAADARWVPLADVGELDLVDGLYDFLVDHDVVEAARTFEL